MYSKWRARRLYPRGAGYRGRLELSPWATWANPASASWAKYCSNIIRRPTRSSPPLNPWAAKWHHGHHGLFPVLRLRRHRRPRNAARQLEPGDRGQGTVIAYVEWLRDDVRKALARSTRMSCRAVSRTWPNTAASSATWANARAKAGCSPPKWPNSWKVTCPISLRVFGCLPNHIIIGRGMFEEIKRRYPHANLAAIDYDPGASQGNQPTASACSWPWP